MSQSDWTCRRTRRSWVLRLALVAVMAMAPALAQAQQMFVSSVQQNTVNHTLGIYGERSPPGSGCSLAQALSSCRSCR